MSTQQEALTWQRLDDGKSPGWQLTEPDGTYRLVTDKSVALFGRERTAAMLAAYDLPPLP